MAVSLADLIDGIGASRTQVSAAAGVSPETLRNWMRGHTRPTPTNLRNLAGAFESVSIEALLDASEVTWRNAQFPELRTSA